MRPRAARHVSSLWGSLLKEHCQQVQRNDPFPWFSAGEDTSAVLSVSGLPVQTRYGRTEVGPERGHDSD